MHDEVDWFNAMAAECELPASAARQLLVDGFVIISGPVAQANLPALVAAYDAAVLVAHPDDVSVGKSTTRVHDMANRGSEFDCLYVYQPILAACCTVIGRPFKLSTLHARTVNPNSPEQSLHADFPRETEGWPMVGFIFMVDEFRSDNGATRFVPGSHKWPAHPDKFKENSAAGDVHQVLACGPPGSVVVYNGSVWHGHTANTSNVSRRSIQGAYIRRDATSWINQAERIRPETLSRIGPLAKYLLNI